jgi:hypothetical protein
MKEFIYKKRDNGLMSQRMDNHNPNGGNLILKYWMVLKFYYSKVI